MSHMRQLPSSALHVDMQSGLLCIYAGPLQTSKVLLSKLLSVWKDPAWLHEGCNHATCLAHAW